LKKNRDISCGGLTCTCLASQVEETKQEDDDLLGEEQVQIKPKFSISYFFGVFFTKITHFTLISSQ
jgi:hypothetical protein